MVGKLSGLLGHFGFDIDLTFGLWHLTFNTVGFWQNAARIPWVFG
jgi:hypothetical protein